MFILFSRLWLGWGKKFTTHWSICHLHRCNSAEKNHPPFTHVLHPWAECLFLKHILHLCICFRQYSFCFVLFSIINECVLKTFPCLVRWSHRGDAEWHIPIGLIGLAQVHIILLTEPLIIQEKRKRLHSFHSAPRLSVRASAYCFAPFVRTGKMPCSGVHRLVNRWCMRLTPGRWKREFPWLTWLTEIRTGELIRDIFCKQRMLY